MIGTAFLIMAVFFYTSTSAFITSSKSAEGEVTELIIPSGSDTYHPKVRFQTESGKEVIFVDSVGSTPPSFTVGESVKVFYQPDNPQNAKISSFFSLWFLVVVFGLMGFIFDIIGAVIIILSQKSKSAQDFFQKNGRIVEADILHVSSRLSRDGKQKFVIISNWRDPKDNKMYTFESAELEIDPTERLKQGQKIGVYIDPHRPERNQTDLGGL